HCRELSNRARNRPKAPAKQLTIAAIASQTNTSFRSTKVSRKGFKAAVKLPTAFPAKSLPNYLRHQP
ncbi:MAG: hypothetical protein ACUVSC_14070, partial [Candidatus Fervidibacter sp.]|uniref:hypothetical protein n=1 Tax=Candidatus Fervidibacter sp. TaxID=3100871 RepID=UPI00404A906C